LTTIVGGYNIIRFEAEATMWNIDNDGRPTEKLTATNFYEIEVGEVPEYFFIPPEKTHLHVGEIRGMMRERPDD
jgi:hypothetical protein